MKTANFLFLSNMQCVNKSSSILLKAVPDHQLFHSGGLQRAVVYQLTMLTHPLGSLHIYSDIKMFTASF